MKNARLKNVWLKKLGLLAALTILMTVPMVASVGAQGVGNYKQRQSDLVALASIFGELHHIRRTCEPRLEGDIWRERMKKLITLEQPQATLREQMVSNFNKGYRAAQQHFPVCVRRSRDHAAARAMRGDVIIARLTAPLYGAMNEEEETAPFIWQGEGNRSE